MRTLAACDKLPLTPPDTQILASVRQLFNARQIGPRQRTISSSGRHQRPIRSVAPPRLRSRCSRKKVAARCRRRLCLAIVESAIDDSSCPFEQPAWDQATSRRKSPELAFATGFLPDATPLNEDTTCDAS